MKGGLETGHADSLPTSTQGFFVFPATITTFCYPSKLSPICISEVTVIKQAQMLSF